MPQSFISEDFIGKFNCGIVLVVLSLSATDVGFLSSKKGFMFGSNGKI